MGPSARGTEPGRVWLIPQAPGCLTTENVEYLISEKEATR